MMVVSGHRANVHDVKASHWISKITWKHCGGRRNECFARRQNVRSLQCSSDGWRLGRFYWYRRPEVIEVLQCRFTRQQSACFGEACESELHVLRPVLRGQFVEQGVKPWILAKGGIQKRQ